MIVTLNGSSREIADDVTIAELLANWGRSPEHVVVEYNGEVLDVSEFANVRLQSADCLEVLHLVGGG